MSNNYGEGSNLVSNNAFTPVAVVGLEETFYSTPEDGGAVEVCVVVHLPDIDCPIKFPFTVLLFTRDFSAGICVLLRYVPPFILFTSLQSLPWIIVQLLTQ